MKKIRILVLLLLAMSVLCNVDAQTIQTVDAFVKAPVLKIDDASLDGSAVAQVPVKIEIPDNSFTKEKYNIWPGYCAELYLYVSIPKGFDLEDVRDGQFTDETGNTFRMRYRGIENVSDGLLKVTFSTEADYATHFNENWASVGVTTGVAATFVLRANADYMGGDATFTITHQSYAKMQMIMNTARYVYVQPAQATITGSWDEGTLPEFSFKPVTLKAGGSDYMKLALISNNMPVSNIKMEVYLPENITSRESSFGMQGFDDMMWKKCSYNSSKGCYEVEFGSQSGNYSFEDDDDLMSFAVVAGSGFNKTSSVVVKNFMVTFVHNKKEVQLDNVVGIINFDATHEVSPNATKFKMGHFMTPGEAQMRSGGATIDIPVRMEFTRRVRHIEMNINVPEGLTVVDVKPNEDVMPPNLDLTNRYQWTWGKTGTNIYRLYSHANANGSGSWNTNYWRVAGTAPSFYITVQASADFAGGAVSLTDIITRTEDNLSDSQAANVYCADASCNVTVVTLRDMELSVDEIEREITAGGTATSTIKAVWDSRDKVYGMNITMIVPRGLTATGASISERRGFYGHRASLSQVNDTTYSIRIYNSDEDEYMTSSYGDLVTVNFKADNTFESGLVKCRQALARTMFYPEEGPVKGFQNIHFYVLESDEPVLEGDVDGNGVVNGSDVTALYNKLLNGSDPAGNPDVDGNGVVNGSDVTALYNLLLSN